MILVNRIKNSYYDGKKARSIKNERNSLVVGYGGFVRMFDGSESDFVREHLEKAGDKVTVELITGQERLEILEGKQRGLLEGYAYNFGLYGRFTPSPLDKLLPNL